VIRGLGASSDGGARGITAPDSDGQLRAVRRAYREAGVAPSTVGLVEAHGTSTPVGDAAEVRTLCRLLETENLAPGAVALGSVKSNIGHLKSAAGAAGLVKAVLALEHRVLPPSLNFESPNEALLQPDLPVRVITEAEEWRAGAHPRRVGVSAFGFGGTNFHAVIEEAPQTGPRVYPAPVPEPEPLPLPGTGLLRLGAGSRAELRARLETLGREVSAGTPFAELCERYGRPVATAEVRCAITARDASELQDRLEGLLTLFERGKGELRLAGAGTFVG
jgi:acyl transferase domain-containing protein